MDMVCALFAAKCQSIGPRHQAGGEPSRYQSSRMARLEDKAADLKERTLGVAVFGREPTYDTSTDPIVRATAGEIRKRIAQYYQEPGHEHEIRISLSPGSYIPEFNMPAVPPAAPPTES